MLSIFSYLLPNEPAFVNDAFKDDSWDIQACIRTLEADEMDGKIIARSCLPSRNIEPIISHDEGLGKHETIWRIWYPLIDFFRLSLNGKGDGYIDPYSEFSVIRIKNPASNGRVEIRTDYLQEYLAARSMILIRQHDHRRFWHAKIEALESHYDSKLVKEKWGIYRINYNTEGIFGDKCFSRICAKDFIPPANATGLIGYYTRDNIVRDNLPEFIIARRPTGELIKNKPNEDDILHPVYFKPEVLMKFYGEPSIYEVRFISDGLGTISRSGLWSLTFGRNEENLIIIWLGDLVKQGLAIDEIRHWHSHNVVPMGEVATDFWESQMECNPPSVPSMEERLFYIRSVLSSLFSFEETEYFVEFNGPDRYLLKLLRSPLIDDFNEFKSCVEVLSKVFIEYINSTGCKAKISERNRNYNSKDNRPLEVVGDYLQNVIHVDPEMTNRFIASLKDIQLVRSKLGVAHRSTDSGSKEVLRKLNLECDPGYIKLFRIIAGQLAECSESIIKSFGKEKELWWFRTKDE
jgi:hypothetical protein